MAPRRHSPSALRGRDPHTIWPAQNRRDSFSIIIGRIIAKTKKKFKLRFEKNLYLNPPVISVIFVFNMILQNFPVKEKVEK